MDEQQVRAVLAVMNFTAPFGFVWIANRVATETWIREMYDIQDSIRFYLVPDDSSFLLEKGVIHA